VGSRRQQVTHLGRVVGERDQGHIVGRDVPLGEHALAHPVDEAAPVTRAHEHDRELCDLPGLDQRQRLPELVHGPEAAREDDEPAGVADEHDLAREEVVELERDVAVGIAALLERQLVVEPHRQGAGVLSAAVGRFHQAGPAARDDRHAALPDHAGGLARELVIAIVRLRARGAEEAGRGAHARERIEAGAQLLADPVDPVLVGEGRANRRLLRGDDLLVEGAWLAGHSGPRLDGRRSLEAGHPGSPFPPEGKYELALPSCQRTNAVAVAQLRAPD